MLPGLTWCWWLMLVMMLMTSTAGDERAATAKFKEVAAAYAVLGDPGRRARYDTHGGQDDEVDFGWEDVGGEDRQYWRCPPPLPYTHQSFQPPPPWLDPFEMFAREIFR